MIDAVMRPHLTAIHAYVSMRHPSLPFTPSWASCYADVSHVGALCEGVADFGLACCLCFPCI